MRECSVGKQEAIGARTTARFSNAKQSAAPFVDAQAKAIGRRNDWGVHP